MHAHKGIHGFLILGAAHTQGFAVGGDPAWFVGLRIGSQAQRLTGSQSGERLEHQLPTQRCRPNVRKQQGPHFVQGLRIVGHEFPAMPDVPGDAVAWATKSQGVLSNQVQAHSPKNRVAEGVHFQVHRAVTGPAQYPFLAPFVVTVTGDQGKIIDGDPCPKFEKHGAITGLAFERSPLPRLFLPVRETVFLVAAEDVPDGQGRVIRWGCQRAEARTPSVQFFAGVFEVFGFEGTECPATGDFWPFKQAARAVIFPNSVSNSFPMLCFRFRVHSVRRYTLERVSPSKPSYTKSYMRLFQHTGRSINTLFLLVRPTGIEPVTF